MSARSGLFTIVHDDRDICVVDKPPGLLSYPIPRSTVKNLMDLMRSHYAGDPGVTVKSVHRIDRYTSGLVVFAKTTRAYKSLFDQFKRHTPVRCYLALVRGVMENDEGELIHYLKLVKEGFRNIVVPVGQAGATKAQLKYNVRERFLASTLLEAYLDTGLKNQIRVQFEAIGHQLVGDQHYAPEEGEELLINRQALHAWKLSFIHPSTGQPVTYIANLPADMLRIIDRHRWERDMKRGGH